ncbi:MAG: TraR/DksA C4-type zinc finger protein, partial [Pseudomonadota bacterium]
NTGLGVRVASKNNVVRPDKEHMALIQKMIANELSDAERERFQELHRKRSFMVLETPVEKMFHITATTMILPKKARIEPSEICARCGEPVMKSKLATLNGDRVCRGCLEQSLR